MPFPILPPFIQLGEFVDGYMPDAPPASVPETGLRDVSNLLPDPVTHALSTRPGTDDLVVGSDLGGYDPKYVFYFECIFSGSRHKYLIIIFVKDTYVDNEANNQKFAVYSFDSSTLTVKHSFQAVKTRYEHWGDAASNTWYGGTGGMPMYSWKPETDTFDADASAGNFKTMLEDPTDLSDISTERPSDYAFKKGDTVIWDNNDKTYSTTRGIRFEKWESGAKYRVSDTVSRWADHAGTGENYWKSYRCLQSHVAGSGPDDEPGTGTDYLTFWRPIILDPPLDADDGEPTDDWFFVPTASESIIGKFHGGRLWLRRHDSDNWSWLQYSAPFKPEKNKDIADLVFNPADWAPQDDVDGDGGGWLNFREGDGDAIRCIQPLGSYLIVFKRWGTWVIAGTREDTWNVRVLDPEVGTIGPRSVCVVDGLVYFLSPNGNMYVTDGTQIQEAPGSGKVQEFLRGYIDGQLSTDDTTNWLASLTPFKGYIYMALSNPSGTTGHNKRTVVYDPGLGSFWPTDLPILDACTGRIGGVEKMWFTRTIKTATLPDVYELSDSFTTDNGTAIAWTMTTGWCNFGLERQDRRIRKMWALCDIPNAEALTIVGYRNYLSSAAFTQARTMHEGTESFEGLWMADARAISYKLSGAKAPSIVYGIAVQTQPRHSTRYHNQYQS